MPTCLDKAVKHWERKGACINKGFWQGHGAEDPRYSPRQQEELGTEAGIRVAKHSLQSLPPGEGREQDKRSGRLQQGGAF